MWVNKEDRKKLKWVLKLADERNGVLAALESLYTPRTNPVNTILRWRRNERVDGMVWVVVSAILSVTSAVVAILTNIEVYGLLFVAIPLIVFTLLIQLLGRTDSEQKVLASSALSFARSFWDFTYESKVVTVLNRAHSCSVEELTEKVHAHLTSLAEDIHEQVSMLQGPSDAEELGLRTNFIRQVSQSFLTLYGAACNLRLISSKDFAKIYKKNEDEIEPVSANPTTPE